VSILVVSALNKPIETMEQRLRETIVRLLMDGETLSLERAKGQTYQSADATLYALGVYPKSSVLAGQQKRTNVHSWDSYEKAKSVLDASLIKYEDLYEVGGTSYISVDRMVAHLPEEDSE
jgi:hypothetical protein